MSNLRRMLIVGLGILYFVNPGNAQQTASPVTAIISVSKQTLFEKETFELTLTITTTGVRLRQTLGLENLPDKNQVDIFSEFETLPTKRIPNGHRITEIQRYRCQARPMSSGVIRIAPTLKLAAMRRRRMLIGSAWEEFPLDVTIEPIELNVSPLPEAPSDFSGVVGDFTLSASIIPSDIAVGDLVTLTTRLEGRGFTDTYKPLLLSSSPHIKVYPPKLARSDDNQLVFDQVVIPQTDGVTAIPEISFTYFDTTKGAYRTITKGPFPLTYHANRSSTFEHFRPEDEPNNVIQCKTEPAHVETRWNYLLKLIGRARYEDGVCMESTQVHLAPSLTSYVTFELPSDTTVTIIQKTDDWILIESEQRRGWIPAEALKREL